MNDHDPRPDDATRDDAVVARLRAALDEVAASAPRASDADGTGGTAGDHDPRRRWLAAAAVTVVLAGGAAWAIAQRDPDDRSASAPVETTSATPGPTLDPTASPASTVPAVTVTTVASPVTSTEPTASNTAASTTTSLPTPPETLRPWFALDLPGFTAGDVSEGGPAVGPDRYLFQSWLITTDAGQGLLTITIRDDVEPGTEGDYTVETLTVPEGEALFLQPNGTDGPLGYGYELRWFHDDGTAWLFQSTGLDRDTLVSVALAAQPGSGLPVVIPDERASVLTTGALTGEHVTQEWSDGTGTVWISVVPDGSAPVNLVFAANVVEVTVAGTPGFAALDSSGYVRAIWDAGGGYWGVAMISPELARGADGILAAIVAAPSP